MQALKCDRCGKYQSPVITENGKLYHAKASVKFSSKKAPTEGASKLEWFDLCEDCTNEFMKEFMGKETE